MATPFLGQIIVVPYNFEPVGWAFCNGQLLSIADNTALFALLGTIYGGDGKTTFALPNLQGCIPVGAGQGVGLSPYILGQSGGSSSITINTSQMPPHSHRLNGSAEVGTDALLNDSKPATPNALPGYQLMYAPGGTNVAMNAGAIALNGGGLPHENRMPFLVFNFIIALVGIFPARS